MSIWKRAWRGALAAVRSLGRRLDRVGLAAEDEWMLTGEECGSVLVRGTVGPVGEVVVRGGSAWLTSTGPLQVRFAGDELDEMAAERLVGALAAMEGVVPADLPIDGRCVGVAALAPEAAEDALRWRVSAHLWLEEGPEPRLVTDLPWDDERGWTVPLAGPEEAWDLVRALRTNEAWQSGLASSVDAVAPTLRRALAALIARRGDVG
jgi:hypothetical protein